MDRFRFRVWDNANNRYVDTFSDAYNRIWRYYIDQNGDLIGVEEDNVDRVQDKDNFIVEQCTGLKDKNGTLIFEGDVLRRDTNGQIIKIIYHKGTFAWMKIVGTAKLMYAEELSDYYTVIGNVHDEQFREVTKMVENERD